MGLQGFSQGGEGYLAIAISWRPDDATDPNKFVAPEQFLLAESKNLEQGYTHIEHDAYVGSRDTDKGHRHGKAAAGGPFSFALYQSNGQDVWEAGLGFSGTVEAIAPDTTIDIQNGPFAAPATAPTTTPSGTGGTLAAGEYEYAVTFKTKYGETTLGPSSAPDTLSGATSSDAISAIPTGPAGTIGRGIYRAKDDGVFGLVKLITDNTTVTWTDIGAVGAATSDISPPVAPDVAGSGSGGTLPAGDYAYAVTLVEGEGETNLGEASAISTLAGATSSVALTTVPLGPAGTTARKIYRQTTFTPMVGPPVTSNWELIHTLADNTSTTYTDTTLTDSRVYPPQRNFSLPANVSCLSLTTGDLAYDQPSMGRPVAIGNTGLTVEMRAVIDYDKDNKYLFVGLLGERDGIEITHAAAGTMVVATECTVARPINSSDFTRDYSNTLPRVSVEDNIGGKYSYLYRSGHIGKLDVKSTAAKTEVASEVMFNKPRVLANGEGSNPAPTAFDDSDESLEELSFEYQDGFLCIESDPDSLQTPMMQRMDDAISWELNLNNNLKEEGPMDGTAVKRFLPGSKRKLDVKLNMLNSADYPVIYEKFVSKDKDAQFLATFVRNDGTDTEPSFGFQSFYCPHVRYVKSSEAQGLTDTVGENVEGVARRAGGLEKMYVYKDDHVWLDPPI